MKKYLVSLVVFIAVLFSGLSDARSDLVHFAIDLATQVYNILDETNGGTGQSTYTTGDILYASSSNTLSKLPVGSNGDILSVTTGLPSWVAGAAGVGSIGTINSQTKSANGAVISGTSLVMQTADATFPGLISATTQTIAGDKTFNGSIIIPNGTTSPINAGGIAIPSGGAVPQYFAFKTGTFNITSGLVGNVLAGQVVSTRYAKTGDPLGTPSVAVSSTSSLGNLGFFGADGTTFRGAADITVSVDGAVSTNVVPGKIVISLADSTGSVSEAVRLNSTRSVQLNNSFYTASLPLKLDSSKIVTSAAINLAGSEVTGVLPATKGGTDQSSYAVGDLLYASSTTALSKLADIATGNALISGGVTTAPSWGKIGLTTHVSGILPEANGGTNQSTYSQGDLLYASASNTLSKLAKDTNATRYLSNTGTSNNPAWAQVDVTTGATAAWTDWSPTYGATGAMTWTSVTTNYAKYIQIGKIVYFIIDAIGTTGSTPSNGLTFTVPITGTTELIAGSGIVLDTGTFSGYWFAGSTTVMIVRKYDATNYNIGANKEFAVSGFYEVP